jgi:hypothetical protein
MAPPVTGIYPSGWNKLIRTIEHPESDHRHRHIGTFKEFVPRLLAQHAGGAGKRFHTHPGIGTPRFCCRWLSHVMTWWFLKSTYYIFSRSQSK